MLPVLGSESRLVRRMIVVGSLEIGAASLGVGGVLSHESAALPSLRPVRLVSVSAVKRSC